MNEVQKISIDNELLHTMLQDLKVYGGCSVCAHHNPYKLVNSCELGGCNGGGSGKNKEDLWEYEGLNTNKIKSTIESPVELFSDKVRFI